MNSLSSEIITLLNQKQKAAFEVIFNLYYPRLVCFAQEYVSFEVARNLVQDAFLSFWEKNPPVISESQLQSYLYTTVKNSCISRLRHEKIKKKFIEESERKIQKQLYISALENLDTSTIAFQEIEVIIERTLADLPPRCRKVFILSRFEGKKNHEVAGELNISQKAVEAQITKALKIFRIALKDFLPLVAYLLVVR
ncbi:RNA polymerase sigma-70 factor [Maribellus maritimus]|uniref:RNA polymerase sigma-70 factor n=1 Tax=Maribellus maritimus TaxID=2870838 RepID=UPI001EEB8C4A|nr:RNA polymerase sigma-70 factor [Maribellus maritimus]MCG6189534.1 RNA polymerase sigma-70 factor [Maribellus maritimus]